MSTNSQANTLAPASTIHIGSDARHVTVHIHNHYYNGESHNTSENHTSERTSDVNQSSERTSDVVNQSSERTSDVVNQSSERTSDVNEPFILHSPSTRTPRYNERRQSSEIPLNETISSALSALPEGILPPTLQSVVQQVLHRQHSSINGQHSPIRTSNRQQEQNTVDTTARSNQREQNVAISFMMQPVSGQSVSLMDLFQQLTQDGDDSNSNNGISITELNRHTSIETYDSQNSRHDTCAVCRESFTTGQPVRRIERCGHVFHTTCMDRWLESHSTCPLCMQTIIPTEDNNNESNTESASVHSEHSTQTQNRTSSPLEQSTLPTNPLTNLNNGIHIREPGNISVQRLPDDEILNSAMDELTFDNDEDEGDDSCEQIV